MILNLDHIALLSSNLSSVIATLPSWIRLDEPERHPSEGTLEQYAHLPSEHAPSLLILEPISDGPYSRAMAKRGPGLHHFGFVTDTLDDAIDYFASHGLLLHPISRYTYKKNVAWMCRPGVPFQVEIYTLPEVTQAKGKDIRMEIPCQDGGDLSLINWLPGIDIHVTQSSETAVSLDDIQLKINLANEQGA